MKRFFSTFLTVITVLAFLLLSVACTGAGLDTPVNLSIDAENLLTWSPVSDARFYAVEIVDVVSKERVEKRARLAQYPLNELEEGDYDIRVRAIKGNNEAFSEWSEVFSFHRDLEMGIRFTLINNDSEYEVTKIGSASGKVIIEREYRGKPVTRIADGAFRGSGKIEELEIGENVTYIGLNAFYNCSNLAVATLPESVSFIGEKAFQGCGSLSKINLPASVTVVYPYTFAYCRALESISFGENVTEIGEGAFYNCSSLGAIKLPDAVRTVGDYAFEGGESITALSVGSGITAIGNYAFEGCISLGTVSFSKLDGELTIGAYAFSACKQIKEFAVPDGTTSLGSALLYNSENLESITIPASVTEVGAYIVNGTKLYSTQLTGQGDYSGYIYAGNWLTAVSPEILVDLPEVNLTTLKTGTVGIAAQTFVISVGGITVGAPMLQSVNLPASVKYVGELAFYRCISLSSFVANQGGLISVGNRAFQQCEALTTVWFAENLLSIGNYAFYGCKSVDNNISFPERLVPNSVARIGTDAYFDTALWNNTPAGEIVYASHWAVGVNGAIFLQADLQSGTVGISDYAFYRQTFMSSVSGVQDVTHIGRGAFSFCASLTALTLNRNLRTIEDFTFDSCTGLYRVNLPARLTSIGKAAFYECESLSELDLSNTYVESIGERAFYGCLNLERLDLGDSLESIGERAFYRNISIKELVIPDTVVEIGGAAFAKCTKLESLTFGPSVETVGDYAFYGCTALSGAIDLSSVKTLGDGAFYNCSKVEKISLGEGLTSIGSYAFAHLRALSSVVLPASVTTVGDCAFKDCGLTSVVMAGEIASIGTHAFYGCPNLTVFAVAGVPGGSWNTSFRPVVFGCTLSEDGSYVTSVTVGNILYAHAFGGIGAPVRAGYEFVGWAESAGAQEALYGAGELGGVAFGTTLYAVWKPISQENNP